MNPYTFATVLVLCITAAVIVIVFAKRTKETAQDGFNKGERVLNRGLDTLAPIPRGLGNIADAVADRIRTNQQEINDLREKAQRQAEEIENLKSRRIEVTQIIPVLQLALTKVNFSYFDFHNEIVKESSPTIGRDEKFEVLIATRANYSQSLGVDLDKLRFQITDSSTIQVSGLGITLVGINDLDIKFLHSEMRLHKGKSKLLPDSSQIVNDADGFLNREKDSRLQVILQEVNRQQSVKAVDEAIDRLVMRFLEVCFGSRHAVQPVLNLPGGKPFREICTEINSSFDREVIRKQQELSTVQKEIQTKQEILIRDVKRDVYERGQ